MSCKDISVNEHLVSPEITGVVELDLSASLSIVEAIKELMWAELEANLAEWIAQAHIALTVDELTVVKELVLGDDAKAKLAKIIEELLKAHVINLDGVKIHGATLYNATLDADTLSKVFAKLSAAPYIASLALALKPIILPWLVPALNGATLTDVDLYGGTHTNVDSVGGTISRSEISNSVIKGGTTIDDELLLTQVAKDSLVASITKEINEAVRNALPLSCDGDIIDCRGVVTCDIWAEFVRWVEQQIALIWEGIKQVNIRVDLLETVVEKLEIKVDNLLPTYPACDGGLIGSQALVGCTQYKKDKIEIAESIKELIPTYPACDGGVIGGQALVGCDQYKRDKADQQAWMLALARRMIPVGLFAYFPVGAVPGGLWLPCRGEPFAQATAPEAFKFLVDVGVVPTSPGIIRAPDGRGVVIIGKNYGRHGDSQELSLLQYAPDYIRNISGSLGFLATRWISMADGVFQGYVGDGPMETQTTMTSAGVQKYARGVFDASTMVPTGPENKPKTITMNLFMSAGVSV